MDIKQLNQETDDVASDPVDRLLQEKKPASSGKSVAVLALLVAMASVAATSWQWWQMQSTGPDQASQADQLARVQESQQQLTSSVASIKAGLAGLEAPVDLTGMEERLQSTENQLSIFQEQSAEDRSSISAVQGGVRSLEQRLSATESGLVSVAASNQNSDVELDIAEIDFLLRVASERVQLFSDLSAADLALQAADVQLEALNDPMFLSVRQRIAIARQDLATVPRLDSVLLTAELADMQSRVSALPFRGEAETVPDPEPVENAGWWESFKTTLSSLVTVRRRAPEEQSTLSLDDKDYLRQGLWLQFESARMALMRNDSAAYNDSLARVNKTLNQFFENGSSQVQAMLLEISTLQQVDIAPEIPDISGPWTQLRQLRDSRRLLQSATPVEMEDSSE